MLGLMRPKELADRLLAHGVKPSAQRLAIAEFVLETKEHPSADRVLDEVRARLPMVSRATVYNTLNLFVERGLLKRLSLTEGYAVYDPCSDPHHHLVNEETGEIRDIPWDVLTVEGLAKLADLEGISPEDLVAHQVVVRVKRA